MAWGGFLDGLLKKLPIQDRKERWRNQIDKLEREKKEMLYGEWTLKKANRRAVIERELDRLNGLCKNQE